MDWFQQLRAVLADYYPAAGPQDIVGYLRGSSNPKVWRSMTQTGREQMLILGSVPPTDQEWAAAGVAGRGDVQTIRFDDLRTFIITYGGFMVTRPWGKISILSADLLRTYGITLSQFTASLSQKNSRKLKAIAQLKDLIDRTSQKMEQTSGEHKIAAGMLTGSQGNVIGFIGYWTNHLFNTDVPSQMIWMKCTTELANARAALREGKLEDAARAAVRARAAMLEASGIYYRWKDGIDGAGVKMQVAIGVVALLIVAAVVAPSALTKVAPEVESVEKVASLIDKADSLLVRVVTSTSEGASSPAVSAYEQALEEAQEAAAEWMRMVQ
jgi:hypothetical protein